VRTRQREKSRKRGFGFLSFEFAQHGDRFTGADPDGMMLSVVFYIVPSFLVFLEPGAKLGSLYKEIHLDSTSGPWRDRRPSERSRQLGEASVIIDVVERGRAVQVLQSIGKFWLLVLVFGCSDHVVERGR
jgi:hypothetical protein